MLRGNNATTLPQETAMSGDTKSASTKSAAISRRRLNAFGLALGLIGPAFLLTPGPARADRQVFRRDYAVKLGRFETRLPVEAVVDMGEFGKPAPFILRADLSPIIAEREALIEGTGVNDRLPDGFTYNGTLIDVGGRHLHIKYHFTARKKFKVLGVPSSVSTDASVETWLVASVAGNRLRLAVDPAMGEKNGFTLNISNTAVDIAADVFDVRADQLAGMARKADAFLGSDEAALGVPEQLRKADVRPAAARFAIFEGRPVLEVEGQLTLGVEAWWALITSSGSK